MAKNLGEAGKKLNKSEYVLYLSTEVSYIQKLSPKQIEGRIDRIQNLLDKLKAEKQSGGRIRRVLGLSGNGEKVNKVKMKYFTEGLKRLKKEQKRRNTQVQAEKNKLIAEARKNQIIKKMNSSIAQPKVDVKKAVDEQNLRVNTKKAPFVNSETKRKNGHASARNKRAQEKKILDKNL